MKNSLIYTRSFAADVLVPLMSSPQLPQRLAQLTETYGLAGTHWQDRFKGEFKETRVLTGVIEGQETTVHLLGMGTKTNPSDWLHAFRHFVHKLRKELTEDLLFDWSFLPQEHCANYWESALTGAYISAYRTDDYRPEADVMPTFLAENAQWKHFSALPEKVGENLLESAKNTAYSMQFAMHMVDAPANHKSPRQMVAWAKGSADLHGYELEIFDRPQLQKMGMHALLAVGQGSATPPYFMVAHYRGGAADAPSLALVGKGVTFDTGGLSIKAAANMHYMKSDMGGAAAVLGALDLAARLKLPINLTVVVPTTENSVGSNSYRPSDVISSYSGKSIEIIDTDAEGRLILADGLAYVLKNHPPTVILDLATLTGSSIRALGYACGALFTKNEALKNILLETGDHVGERLWALPMWEEYGEMMKSDVADIKNLSARPIAGAITAAKFLEFFTEEHPAWAHLDIAGVALRESEYGSSRLATGYGVRLLVAFMKRLIDQQFEL